MHSSAPNPEELRQNLEREVLRALCDLRAVDLASQVHPVKSRAALIEELLAYHWHDQEHRVVFDAIARLPRRSGIELRQQLPAQATRMGFPDVQWNEYFGPAQPAEDFLEKLVAELFAAAR